MSLYTFDPAELDNSTREFYRDTLVKLNEAGVQYLIGGAYALAAYTGFVRHTKDLDLFLKPRDAERALEVLTGAGYRTELTQRVWLAKAFCGKAFVDFIFRSGNGLCEVDEEWFAHACPSRVLGVPVQLCAPEEAMWSKAFVQERERYDGADMNHYILSCSERLDWERLMRHFGPHWRVLFSHLILFGFVYPGERDRIPREVMEDMVQRLQEEMLTPAPRTDMCHGPLLNRAFYLVDVDNWGFRDARMQPHGTLEETDIRQWENELNREKENILDMHGISLEGSSSRPGEEKN